MNEPEKPSDRFALRPGLEITEPDPSHVRPAVPPPTVGPAAETGEYTPPPATGVASAPPDDGHDTDATGGATRPFAGAGHPDTEPLSLGGTTADEPCGGDRGATASFGLAPGLDDDSDATLPPPAQETASALPRIAGYELLEVLGAGGMGIVYKALRPPLDRFVALKMIRAGAGARRSELVRFEAEARAVAAINRPNIIKIFEINEYGGLLLCRKPANSHAGRVVL